MNRIAIITTMNRIAIITTINRMAIVTYLQEEAEDSKGGSWVDTLQRGII